MMWSVSPSEGNDQPLPWLDYQVLCLAPLKLPQEQKWTTPPRNGDPVVGHTQNSSRCPWRKPSIGVPNRMLEWYVGEFFLGALVPSFFGGHDIYLVLMVDMVGFEKQNQETKNEHVQ
eukprot:1156350-Pelagomonas_calceolata.AAC.9